MRRNVLRTCGALAAVLTLTVAGSACAAEQGDAKAAGPKATEEQPIKATPEVVDQEEGFASQTECLLGAWLAGNDGFTEYMRGQMALEGGTADSVTGEVILTFENETLTNTAYTDWTINSTVEGMSSALVRNGTDSGTYLVEDDSRLTMQETSSDSMLEMYVNGAHVSSMPTTNTLPLASSPFTCSEDLLVITTTETDLEMTRIP